MRAFTKEQELSCDTVAEFSSVSARHCHKAADISVIVFDDLMDNGRKPMKRTITLVLAALAAAAVFAGLVHAVLVGADVSEPAVTTLRGMTPGRLWATTAAALALAGVAVGGLALRRAAARIGPGNGRMGAIVALVLGLIAAENGGLNVAVAKGGPGTGNGVVGGAAALVLGLLAVALGGLARLRSRHSADRKCGPAGTSRGQAELKQQR